ncbi:MAG: hypothetical protein PHD01_05715 [Geobacteraceae bacterium]|nr:hypothetical protein [Geobacteraceae bacterium]
MIEFTNNQHNPAIVVVAYNRPNSLSRLLKSLSEADYEGYGDIQLVISIDKSDTELVRCLAEKYEWLHGPKKVIAHDSRLGLRKHVLSCGDLTSQYGSVIIFEDDLLVSPAFYHYAKSSLSFYYNSDNICGISLNSPSLNEYASLTFIPIDDGFDNYFMQTTSSRGQMWTHQQWISFRKWFDENFTRGISINDGLPEKVVKWPETSWKKYFIKYQIVTGKYFVYPRISLSTNFGDSGTHFTDVGNLLQVPLLTRKKSWNFSSTDNSLAFYDSFYELHGSTINKLIPDFELNGAVECDLFGVKKLAMINTPYLLSVKPCRSPISSFDNQMVPSILNCLYNIEGRFISLGKVQDFDELNQSKKLEMAYNLTPFLGWRMLIKIGIHRVLLRIKNRLLYWTGNK